MIEIFRRYSQANEDCLIGHSRYAVKLKRSKRISASYSKNKGSTFLLSSVFNFGLDFQMDSL